MVPQVFRFRYPLECGGKRHYLHLLPALDQSRNNTDSATSRLKPLAERSIDVAFLGGTQAHDVLRQHRCEAPWRTGASSLEEGGR